MLKTIIVSIALCSTMKHIFTYTKIIIVNDIETETKQMWNKSLSDALREVVKSCVGRFIYLQRWLEVSISRNFSIDENNAGEIQTLLE